MLTTPLLLRKPCELFASVVRVCQQQLGFLVANVLQMFYFTRNHGLRQVDLSVFLLHHFFSEWDECVFHEMCCSFTSKCTKMRLTPGSGRGGGSLTPLRHPGYTNVNKRRFFRVMQIRLHLILAGFESRGFLATFGRKHRARIIGAK